MSRGSGTVSDRRAGVASPPVPWIVRRAHLVEHGLISVEFRDGTTGTMDMRPRLHGSPKGLFADLRDPAVFAAFGTEHGALEWPNGVDLAPDAMYASIREYGTWVLR